MPQLNIGQLSSQAVKGGACAFQLHRDAIRPSDLVLVIAEDQLLDHVREVPEHLARAATRHMELRRRLAEALVVILALSVNRAPRSLW